jgi:FMN phosphatase YigB (HAD superfamily)
MIRTIDRCTTILLDMNDTFMFNADRFSPQEDYAIAYRQLGGALESRRVNSLIRSAYDYLAVRYPDPQYHEAFPSLRQAFISAQGNELLTGNELDRLIDTFALHELGVVPPEYAAAIAQLAQHFRLGLVVDIWAPKARWVAALTQCGVLPLCEYASFSSDHGIVKPSPRPFLNVLGQMGVNPGEAIVIGDSVRRDLGGATAAGIGCILVGGAQDTGAIASMANLIEVTASIVSSI